MGACSNPVWMKVVVILMTLGLSACASASPSGPENKETRARQANAIPEKVIAAEYILSGDKHLTQGSLTELLRYLSVKEIKTLGSGQYLVRFASDPGIERVRECLSVAQAPVTVQPNFVYKLEPPVGSQNPQQNRLK